MKGIEVAFEGRLGRPAERKVTSAGRAFLAFSVITGEGDDEQWLNCSAWSDSLVDMAEHLKQGVEVYIEGKLKVRRWQGESGERFGLQVSASTVQPLALIGHKKPKTSRAAKGKAKADSQAPIEGRTPEFNDALPF